MLNNALYIGDESISIYNWVTERSLHLTMIKTKQNNNFTRRKSRSSQIGTSRNVKKKKKKKTE
jgi:hypothetical protein